MGYMVTTIATESISIDAVPVRCRVVRHVVPSHDRDVVVLEYERSDGSAGRIVIPKAMLAPHIHAVSNPPTTTVFSAWSCDSCGHTVCPFTRQDTADEMFCGREECALDHR